MSTYTPISTQTLTSAAASVTFSGIPQNYTDLRLVVNVIDATGNIRGDVRFNGDSGTNYSRTGISGNGSAASSYRGSNETAWIVDNAGQINGGAFFTLDIMNYSNTTTNKTGIARSTSAADHARAIVFLWRNTAAITSFTVAPASGNYGIGSTFTLYGIGSGSPKAFGGDIVTTDGTYWYHAFTSSGVFSPVQNLSCDVLVVAGGGGAARNFAGGGGAGGCLAFSSQNLTSGQAYTTTIGAGSAGVASDSTRPSNGSNSQFGSLTAASGGGYGGTRFAATATGGNGGSGGGAAYNSTTVATGTSGQGNNGGVWVNVANGNFSAGGGGAGGVGGNPTATDNGGTGGLGTDNVTNWGALAAAFTATGAGVGGRIAGGGGGTGDTTNGSATGGGGAGSNGSTNNATVNTGGGGGGRKDNVGSGGSGGSGIVIVRYLV
jgi:hypothetical protein